LLTVIALGVPLIKPVNHDGQLPYSVTQQGDGSQQQQDCDHLDTRRAESRQVQYASQEREHPNARHHWLDDRRAA
jgi:hypothetical protein